MKKFLLLAAIFAVVLVLTGIKPAKAGGASLEVQFTQSFNHVDFSVTWVTDEPAETANWDFLFGDGTKTVLVGVTGSETFSHDYEYMPSAVSTHYPSVSLPSSGGSGYWTDPWQGVVIIDDRPIEPVTYKVYLPFVAKPGPVPFCSIEISEQTINHVVFDVVWNGAGTGVHDFSFGDGATTQQFSGISGNGTTWHDYSWPGGDFVVTMNLSGGGNCTAQVNIDWP